MMAANNIYAAGDVTGEPMLETVAAREGMIAATNALEGNKLKMEYSHIPRCIFTDPKFASVGLTEEQTNRRGIVCNCHLIPIEILPKAQLLMEKRGAIKIIIDKKTEEIKGIHLLSTHAEEIIHEAVMILKNKMKVEDVIKTIHVFPTLSEIIKIATQSFKRDITKMSCCVE
ncbi:MAG: hypothetical protein ACTSQY_04105 [Candidatus Odinarchaeia archaeon]